MRARKQGALVLNRIARLLAHEHAARRRAVSAHQLERQAGEGVQPRRHIAQAQALHHNHALRSPRATARELSICISTRTRMLHEPASKVQQAAHARYVQK